MTACYSKKVVSEGSGAWHPTELSTVTVDILGSFLTEDGRKEVFESRNGEKMKLGESSDILSETLEECIRSMRTGEQCEIVLDPQPILDHGLLMSKGIPQGSQIEYSVCLTSIEEGKEPWDLSNEERVETATRLKSKGSDKFRCGDIRAAAVLYSKALKLIIPIPLADALEEVVELRALLLLNLAACQLKFKQYDNVCINCSKVLELEPNNIKALYRRGLALTCTNDFDRAKKDLLRARQLEPHNRAIVEQMKILDGKKRACDSKYQDALKDMFGGKP